MQYEYTKYNYEDQIKNRSDYKDKESEYTFENGELIITKTEKIKNMPIIIKDGFQIFKYCVENISVKSDTSNLKSIYYIVNSNVSPIETCFITKQSNFVFDFEVLDTQNNKLIVFCYDKYLFTEFDIRTGNVKNNYMVGSNLDLSCKPTSMYIDLSKRHIIFGFNNKIKIYNYPTMISFSVTNIRKYIEIDSNYKLYDLFTKTLYKIDHIVENIQIIDHLNKKIMLLFLSRNKLILINYSNFNDYHIISNYDAINTKNNIIVVLKNNVLELMIFYIDNFNKIKCDKISQIKSYLDFEKDNNNVILKIDDIYLDESEFKALNESVQKNMLNNNLYVKLIKDNTMEVYKIDNNQNIDNQNIDNQII